MHSNFTILSIIVPCFNESDYVEKMLTRLLQADLHYPIIKEIIVVDDGSTDDTAKKLATFVNAHPDKNLKIITHIKNTGKGSCIKTALLHAKGEILVIQDADLEYNPEDFHLLLAPIIRNEADVVIGSRFKGKAEHKGPFILHKIVNKTYTFISNLLNKQNLSDIHSCYKMMRIDVLRNISLKENRFGFDVEMIAKLSHQENVRICEVGISYHGRTFAEGKKINFMDGFRAFYCLIKYNLFSKK
ncbi:MAG: glycosyltransferase family 2 protein [Chitinophagaceae bacterium]|nr:glycosyltransferase family 2 protein [Chitinophagaceae bacterium]